MPPAPPEASLGELLGEAMAAKGLSRRGLAAQLQKRRPRKDIESWRGSVRSYLKGDEQPGPTIAGLLAEILEKPADYFVRPQQRLSVREERDELRELVKRYRQRYGPIPE